MQLALLGLVSAAIAAGGVLQVKVSSRGSNRRFARIPRVLRERPHLLRRADTDNVPLMNEYFDYTADIGIGTPAQPLEILVDTGSSDLWVMSSTNPYCKASASDIQNGLAPNCSEPIIFDSSKSSTFHDTGVPFSIQYGDYSFANGTYVRDTVTINSAAVKNATFGFAEVSNSTEIVFGVGFPALEASVNSTSNGKPVGAYENIPVLLKKQGIVNTVAYSLWLNSPDAPTGTILFGGVDHSKYSGTLGLVPILDVSKKLSKPFSMHVALSGITANGANYGNCSIAELSYPVVLDSGTSFAYLPQAVVDSMASALHGYTFDSSQGIYTGNCSSVSPDDKFVFSFSGIQIPVPFQSFLLAEEGNGDVCDFVVQPSEDAYSTVLGDVFLRYAYAVFDLEHYQIALAPAKLNATDENIEAISGAVPSATSAPAYNVSTSSAIKTHDANQCARPTHTTASAATSSTPSNNLTSVSSARPSYGNSSAATPVTAKTDGVSSYDNSSTSTLAPASGTSAAAPFTVVTSFTTYCPGPTTLVVGSSSYVVTEATTLTITECPCTLPVSTALTQPPMPQRSGKVVPTGTEPGAASYTVVSSLTTYCPRPTTLAVGSNTYVVTEATTLTITDCPCTLPVPTTGSSASAPTHGSPAEKAGEDVPPEPESKSGGTVPSESEQVGSGSPVPSTAPGAASSGISVPGTRATELPASASPPVALSATRSGSAEVGGEPGVAISNGASKIKGWTLGIALLLLAV